MPRSGFQSVRKLPAIDIKTTNAGGGTATDAKARFQGGNVMLPVDSAADLSTLGDIPRHHARSRRHRAAPIGKILKRGLRKPFWFGQERQVH